MSQREDRFAAAITSGMGVMSLVGLATFAVAIEWEVERELWLCRASGYTALTTLLLALCVTPTARLMARRNGSERASWQKSSARSATSFQLDT